VGWIDTLLGRAARELGNVTVEQGRVPRASSPYDSIWVGDRSALSVPAVFSAIDLIASTVASTPFAARTSANALIEPQPLIVTKPDPGCTRYEFVRDLMGSILLRGRGYVHVYARDAVTGKPGAMRVLPVDEVQVTRNAAGYRRFLWDGREWSDRDIRMIGWMSLPGMSIDSDEPVGPIQMARGRIAGEIASNDFTRRLFTDGGIVTSVLKHPLTLDEAEAAALKTAWVTALSGTREPAVLSGGIDFETVQPNLVDLALADLRKEGVLDVARMFRIPPTLLAAEVGGSSLTYQNVQEVWLQFLRLQQSWFVQIESLWTEATPSGQYVYADLDYWLRPDPRGQLDAVIAGVAAGIFTQDEGRKRLGLPPITTTPGVRTVSPAGGDQSA
jgi:HK97 family phage portal protein